MPTPLYIVFLTERFADPGKVRVLVLGQDGKPTLNLAKARYFADRDEAIEAARKVGSAWMATIVEAVAGPGLPALVWDTTGGASGLIRESFAGVGVRHD